MRKGYDESEISFDIDISNCHVHQDKYEYQDNIGNSEYVHEIFPELKTGMIPVMISNDGTVKKAHETSKWHNYAEKMWANAVTVTEETRGKYMSADIGTEIKEEDILTYFVWIPRYKYKLWHTSTSSAFESSYDEPKERSIEIIFESKETEKSNGTQDGEWLTHPAFTFGSDELNGIWVSKFDTGYNGKKSTSEVESNKVLSKANLNGWLLNIHNAFYTVKGMNEPGNVFGLAKDSDTHLMKNIDWGAIAYLSHSEYGTCNEGICEQVYRNVSWYTGCGGDTESDNTWEATCKNGFGTKEDGIYNQSTNKNISGIFDMSGTTHKLVMAHGYYDDKNNYNSASGFTDATYPEAKYVDEYSKVYGSAQYGERILGDATGELGPFKNLNDSWYDENAYFFDDGSFLGRGRGGLFDFYKTSGTDNRFRIVLV